LYVDNGNFVTNTYKNKFAKKAKWLAEEILGELRQESNDVTKKSNMRNFYYNLLKRM
jgi:coiled-coil domain-containing protein 55